MNIAWDETFTQLLVQRRVIIYNTPSYSSSPCLFSVKRKKEKQAISSSVSLVFEEMLFILVPLLSGAHSSRSSAGFSFGCAAALGVPWQRRVPAAQCRQRRERWGRGAALGPSSASSRLSLLCSVIER